MAVFNHRGISVMRSTYPDDWNPQSKESYNDFISNVVVQNLKSEGIINEIPIVQIEVISDGPVPIGHIIRAILSSDQFQMTGLVHQANTILNGFDDAK